MREAKKILSYIKRFYPQEIEIFESMNARDRKHYASYVLRKKEEFFSPSAWLERNVDIGMSFKQIAKKLGISQQEVVEIYNNAMEKVKKIMTQGEYKEYFEDMAEVFHKKMENLKSVQSGSESATTESHTRDLDSKCKVSCDDQTESCLSYFDFVANKRLQSKKAGFKAQEAWLNKNLFDYQKEVVKRACEIGRYALFMDTGLGKSITQMNFAYCVWKHTNKPVLLLAPLAVVFQMLYEAKKFGFELSRVENGVLKNGLNITNYEQLEKLQGVENLSGIVLDESSILKSFTGSTKRALIEMFKDTPYKLACSATPSPNDYLELGNHSEFLNVLPSYEMIMRFFINDTMNAGGYRLKKHAESSFWEWVASWAECISSPSDLGYDDRAFKLPPLRERLHFVDFDTTQYEVNNKGLLFSVQSSNATTLAKNKKASLECRVVKLKEILRDTSVLPHLIWVDTNLEADRLKQTLSEEFDGVVEVRGSDSPEFKAQALGDFANGKIPILITKASIAGMGLNFQNVCNMSFLGLNYSYESYYQAVRRMYRFGQKNEVVVNVIVASSEREILNTIHKKKEQHDKMKLAMTKAICKAKGVDELKINWHTNFKIPSFLCGNQTKYKEAK